MTGEHLLGCPEAQALAGRVVDPAADLAQHLWRQAIRICVGREKAAEPPIGVLDCAFLPRSLRAAEVALDAKLMPEDGIARELRSAVEGDRLPGRGGQGPQLLDPPVMTPVEFRSGFLIKTV